MKLKYFEGCEIWLFVARAHVDAGGRSQAVEKMMKSKIIFQKKITQDRDIFVVNFVHIIPTLRPLKVPHLY